MSCKPISRRGESPPSRTIPSPFTSRRASRGGGRHGSIHCQSLRSLPRAFSRFRCILNSRGRRSSTSPRKSRIGLDMVQPRPLAQIESFPMTALRKYTVAICGTGKRGKVHAEAIHKNDRFQVVAICGRDGERLEVAVRLAGHPEKYQDPAQMLRETRPVVFCFCTPPSVRLLMIKLGVEYGCKLIAYEKPMATSFNEAYEITNLCRK